MFNLVARNTLFNIMYKILLFLLTDFYCCLFGFLDNIGFIRLINSFK